MLELSANIELLFGEADGPAPGRVAGAYGVSSAVPHAARIHAAAEDGFTAVEMWGWQTADLESIGDALRSTGVRLTLLTSEPMARIVDPATHDEFVEGVARSAEVAARLGAPFIVVLAGDERAGVDRRVQHDAVVAALRRAAPVAADRGVTLLLENLNTRVDHPGHFLDRTSEALDIIDEVGDASVRLLFDLYHAVVMDESPAEVLAARLDRVAHVQIADAPGRHEPGSGRIDWAAELGWLVGAGYRGRIGLEYTATTDTRRSLGHIRAVLAGLDTA